jgi:hypothetical protein
MPIFRFISLSWLFCWGFYGVRLAVNANVLVEASDVIIKHFRLLICSLLYDALSVTKTVSVE